MQPFHYCLQVVYLREVSDAESAIQTSAGQREAVKTILDVAHLAEIPNQAKEYQSENGRKHVHLVLFA